MSPRRRLSDAGGFTLIEVLVAMTLFAIGMSGIIALFTAALDLESQADERTEIALALPDVTTEIAQNLLAQLNGERLNSTAAKKMKNREFPLAHQPRYTCRFSIEEMPGATDGRGAFAHVVIVAPAPGGERTYDFGYIPMILKAALDNKASGAPTPR